jgi:hypothetical protein
MLEVGHLPSWSGEPELTLGACGVSDEQHIRGSTAVRILPTSPQRRRRGVSKKDKRTFLEALAAGWSIHAAKLAGHAARLIDKADQFEPCFVPPVKTD